MADQEYDPFNLRKHPGYYAELVQESDPTADVAASYVKNHGQPGGILEAAQANPRGWGDSPLPFDPTGAELRSTSEGGSAFKARPQDLMHPVAEAISPTLGAFGAGQMAGAAYKEAGEGDYQAAGMSLAPLLAGAIMPGVPKGVRPKIAREIDQRGFYSPSLEAAKALPQETGTVQQFTSMLLRHGAKPKELDAVGFHKAFPDPNAKISRQEIEQYLRDNRVQLGQRIHGTVIDRDEASTRMFGKPYVRLDAEQKAWIDSETNSGNVTSARPRFGGENPVVGSWDTPGGIPGSYREVVTTLPPGKLDWKAVPHPEMPGKFAMQAGDGRYWKQPGGQVGWWSSEAGAQAAARETIDGRSAGQKSFDDVNYHSSHWPGITNPVLHYRQKDFLNHADPPSVGALEKVTQPGAAGAPEVWYRGQRAGADAVNHNAPGAIYLTRNPEQASHFARSGEGASVDTYRLGTDKLFDYRKPEQLEPLIKFIETKGKDSIYPGFLGPMSMLTDGARKGDWGILELPAVQKWIKSKGYAGWHMQENGQPTAALYNRNDALPHYGSGEGSQAATSTARSPESNLPSKTRVLDEMQSDWAQRARDQGTRDPAAIERLSQEQAKSNAEYAEMMKVVEQIKDKQWHKAEEGSPERAAYLEAIEKRNEAMNRNMDLSNKLTAAQSGVPSAPYISNTSDWVDLGLKQALIDAAKDPSVSRLAWAPGKVQADRYNLAHQVSGIRYNPERNSLQVSHPAREGWGMLPGSREVTPEQLPDIIGKELTERLLASPRANDPSLASHDGLGWHKIQGADMEFGGEGMKSFYGDMTPEGYQSGIVGTRLQKLVKGLDPEAARVEPTNIGGKSVEGQYGIAEIPGGQFEVYPLRDGDPPINRVFDSPEEADAFLRSNGNLNSSYPSIPITPAMREKILKEGLPLFNIAALSALISRMLGQGPNTDDTTPGENEL